MHDVTYFGQSSGMLKAEYIVYL